MSGKPKYDESAVIDAAMGVFWRHGYAAASISDLTGATGLSRSSLYQRFRDKEGLFEDAVAHYTERVLRRMNRVADERRGNGYGQVEALLREFLPRTQGEPRPSGCMLARGCAEMDDLPDAARAAVQRGVAGQYEVFARIVRAAEAAGELPAGVAVDALAWFYLGTLHAIMNLPQAGAGPAALSGTIDLALSAWPAISARPGTTPDCPAASPSRSAAPAP